MGRSDASKAREKVRFRSPRKRAGRRAESDQGCLSGHPAFGNLTTVFELGDMPEGGGYPNGFVEKVAVAMGVTDMAEVLHLCSGSVRAPLAIDWRPHEGRLGCPDASPAAGRPAAAMLRWQRRAHLVECPHDPPHPRDPGSNCSVVGDVRQLPIRDGSVRWIMADPPYDEEYAEALWRAGKLYPTPTVLLSESARVLVPGGKVALLHHQYPILPPGLKKVAVHGVTTGPGYRIRCLTIAERDDVVATLFDERTE